MWDFFWNKAYGIFQFLYIVVIHIIKGHRVKLKSNVVRIKHFIQSFIIFL